MSTITVTNIKATGETASRSATGIAAAWVNFNGTGTVAIRGSSNASSIVDNGTGDYTTSYANDMADANYAVSVSSSSAAQSNTDTMINPYTWATGSNSIAVNNNSGSSLVDRIYVNFAVHGNLA